MTKILSEDFRSLLDKLNEYIVTEKDINQKDDTELAQNPVDSAPDGEEPSDDVDDILTAPAGLEKVTKSINANELIKVLGIPKDSVVASNFRSAISALKSDHPKLSTVQASALATAFDHLLAHMKKTQLSSIVSSDKVDENSLNMNKIQGYMKKDAPLGSNDEIGQMKSMIDAVSAHGTPNEKKELGLDEQQAEIIKYNSGFGDNLATVAKDPKYKAKVDVVTMRMSASGKPEIVFKTPDGQTLTAEWTDQFGWVADLD